MSDETYTTMEVVAMTGATYRQLDWWVRTGRIPGNGELVNVGSGHRRTWTGEQVARVELLLRASLLVNATLDEAVELLESSVDA